MNRQSSIDIIAFTRYYYQPWIIPRANQSSLRFCASNYVAWILSNQSINQLSTLSTSEEDPSTKKRADATRCNAVLSYPRRTRDRYNLRSELIRLHFHLQTRLPVPVREVGCSYILLIIMLSCTERTNAGTRFKDRPFYLYYWDD